MSRGDVILRLVELTKIYNGKTTVKALNNISTSFKRGEFVAVVGRSGSGKSTLINILGGLDRPTKGDYYCEGNNVSRLNEGHWDALRNKKIGFIFQNYFLIEYLTVYQNVEIALQFQNVPQAMKDAKIKGIVEKVGLIDHIDKLPSQLSGGQRQRVAIARALVKDPDIILADEPTGALDWRTADEVIKLLKGESEDRLVVMVTHDRKIANKYANRIIEIENGEFKHDLIKEEIEQTYQNVFRKIQAVSLKSKDKFLMTFNKIKSNLVRNFFISFSLALAFSFSLIFNGLDRGVRDSYHAYYDALNNTYSNSFSLVSNQKDLLINDFNYSNNRLTTMLIDHNMNVIKGNSKDVVMYNSIATNVIKDTSFPDVTNETKIRLLNNDLSGLSHDKLFIADSEYPENINSIMVTSKFIKDYYKVNYTDELVDYIYQDFYLPRYTFSVQRSITNVPQLLNNIYETESGSGDFKYDTLNQEKVFPLKYETIKIPNYCFNRQGLDKVYLNKCQGYFNEPRLDENFKTYEEYLLYMNYFKNIVNLIDPEYFNILLRSNAIYYIDNFDNINKAYKLIYDVELSLSNKTSVFVNTQNKVKFNISGIIDNDEESIIYLTEENYNNLFTKTDQNIIFVKSFYTISNIDAEQENNVVFEKLKNYRDNSISLVTSDVVESEGICDVNPVSEYKIKENSIFGSIFYLKDYSTCGKENLASSYLNMLNILFSTFFNILMVASIIFYSMLIKVIFKARINEIGVFRSVGSTIKDIKKLFYYEVLFIFTTSAILCVITIFFLNSFTNSLFVGLTNTYTNVINIANINFLLSNNSSIINISYVNLIVQIVIVVSLIVYNSNRSITKIVNTNPIDILREVV